MNRGLVLLFIGLKAIWAIEIKPPTGWIGQKNLPPNVIYLAALIDSAEVSPSLAVSQLKHPCCREGTTSIDSLMRMVESSQARLFPVYKITERGKKNIGKIRGAYFITTYAKGEKDVANLQFFWLQGDYFINVVYTCLLQDLLRLRPEFEKSLATLKADGGADSARAAAAKP